MVSDRRFRPRAGFQNLVVRMARENPRWDTGGSRASCASSATPSAHRQSVASSNATGFRSSRRRHSGRSRTDVRLGASAHLSLYLSIYLSISTSLSGPLPAPHRTPGDTAPTTRRRSPGLPRPQGRRHRLILTSPARPGPAASPDRDVSRGVGGHLARLNGRSIRGRAARCRRWWGSGPAIADRGSVRGAGAGPRARRRRRRDRTRRCAHSNARD
jgi:hypothetical protein